MSVQHLERGRAELDVFVGHAGGIARLVREIHHAHGGLRHALAARQRQPRAVTRTDVITRLLRLEGMISAFLYVTGRWEFGGGASPATVNQVARSVLHIDLEALRAEVRGE